MDAKPMKILIIEDDIDACNDFINCAKKREDIEIVGLTDSNIEGLKYVKVKQPEGIVLDLELNGSTSGDTDAFEFLAQLKKIKMSCNPVVIVTTHINSKRTYEIFHREGVDLIIYKDHPNYSSNNVLNKFIALRQIEPKKTVETLKEEIKDKKEKVSDCIYQELELIGITSKLKGRQYIHDAIAYLIDNTEEDINVIQYLTKLYKKSSNTITGGIKNAIYHAWRETPIEDLLKNYTARINPERGVPTVMEFIYYYVERVRKQI